MVGLVARRKPDETWRQAVEWIAGEYGLAEECLKIFDSGVAAGTEEARAAWEALYEWDCLELSGLDRPWGQGTLP